MQEEAFNETKKNHPAAFAGKDWADLAGNPELSFTAAAYRLRDLQDYAERYAPEKMRQEFTPEEVAAAMYNVGIDGYHEGVDATNGTLGKTGRSYATGVRKRMKVANDVICGSGIWACS